MSNNYTLLFPACKELKKLILCLHVHQTLTEIYCLLIRLLYFFFNFILQNLHYHIFMHNLSRCPQHTYLNLPRFLISHP